MVQKYKKKKIKNKNKKQNKTVKIKENYLNKLTKIHTKEIEKERTKDRHPCFYFAQPYLLLIQDFKSTHVIQMLLS